MKLVARDEGAAKRWLDTDHFTAGGPDPEKCLAQYLKFVGHGDADAQMRIERLVYQKLNAMKHGNPIALTPRHIEEWGDLGTARIGPDQSEFGQKSICFAIEIASQMALLALRAFAEHTLPTEKSRDILDCANELTAKRIALSEVSAQRWSSFP